MDTKSLNELRALAKTLGLKGFSKLRKDELKRLIARAQSKPAAAQSKHPSPTPTKSSPAKAPVPLKSKPRTDVEPPPLKIDPGATSTQIDDEQRVEDAKYASTPPGERSAHTQADADLGEDIERLPDIAESTLRLMPQKPGVLVGYWALPPGTAVREPGHKLRLSIATGDDLAVLEERDVTQDRGSWYFHVDEALSGAEVFLQLGRYQDGRFVTSIPRGSARIPDLSAAHASDRQWWISDERFRAQYLRSGGTARGNKLGWPGSSSSSS
jgi:hypothetical protein